VKIPYLSAALVCLVLAGPATAQLTPDQLAKKCGKKVSNECVIRQFKDSPEASVMRGSIAFQNYCTLCHGKEGRGDGRAARLHSPPPANLVASRLPAEYVIQIVRKGGEAIGRGKGMPPWGEQLTDEQVQDLINYLMSIRV